MEKMVPQFTNEDLLVIQKRIKHTGLLMDMVPIHRSFVDTNNIVLKIKNSDANTSENWMRLSLMASKLSQLDKIDTISALDLLEGRFEPYPYQLKVVLNVLKEKSSTALLADEVGLGKTIEVGLILKEHIVRNNINSILIVAPRALLTQWQDEMSEKFEEDFCTQDDDNFDYSSNRIIISFSKLARNVEKIVNRQWDMVVVDEAHMLINTSSKRRQAVAAIDRRYMLLCTATPLCNKLTDLYSLADLLYPGILGTEKQFKRNFFMDKVGRVCREDTKDELKKTVSKVMVRTLRKESGIPFSDRFVYSLRVKGSKEEYELFYRTISYMKRFLLSQYNYTGNNGSGTNYVLLKEVIALQQSLSSSPTALVKSLENRLKKYPEQKDDIDNLIEKALHVSNYSKIETLINTLNKMPESQAVIFTLRLETAYLLSDILNENYMVARVYEGRLSGHERQNLVKSFREGKVKYLVATDSAAEGLNLQSANVIVNYDLHWNPMKLEQRIGRVHRRGQDRDVSVFNIVIQDTIDDYVLKILFEKINLFKMAVGGLEAVISEVTEDRGLEETIMDILLNSKGARNIEKELDKLREDFEFKREQTSLREEFSSLVLD